MYYEAANKLCSTPGQRVTFTFTRQVRESMWKQWGQRRTFENFNKNHDILKSHITLEASGTMAKLINEMTVSELRQELGKYRLRKTGKTDELRRRLEQFLAHKKTINSFLYKPQPASTEDEKSPTKRRKLQIDNDVKRRLGFELLWCIYGAKGRCWVKRLD